MTKEITNQYYLCQNTNEAKSCENTKKSFFSSLEIDPVKLKNIRPINNLIFFLRYSYIFLIISLPFFSPYKILLT